MATFYAQSFVPELSTAPCDSTWYLETLAETALLRVGVQTLAFLPSSFPELNEQLCELHVCEACWCSLVSPATGDTARIRGL